MGNTTLADQSRKIGYFGSIDRNPLPMADNVSQQECERYQDGAYVEKTDHKMQGTQEPGNAGRQPQEAGDAESQEHSQV